MSEWSTGPIYSEVIFSREATPEDYALFAKLFPEPRVKKPMACLVFVDTAPRIQVLVDGADLAGQDQAWERAR